MTEEQAKALKVGDKVRYIGGGRDEYLTVGKVYEIVGIDSEEDPFILDNGSAAEFIYGNYCNYYEVVAQPTPYRIEIVDTGVDFDGTGMVRIAAYVNDELLAHLRDIEAEQGREAKRAKIREQIAKLETELESLG